MSTKVGRPLERFCKRGHDTEAVGRIRHGWCKSCAQESDKRRDRVRLYSAVYSMREQGDRVASLRLRKLTTRDDAALHWQHRFGVSKSAAMHAANRLFENQWLTIDQADRWCVTLNTPLAMLYPEVYVPDAVSFTGKPVVRV